MRLSRFIREHVSEIVDEWERFARTLGKVGSDLDSVTLRDHSQEILLAICDDLETRQTFSEAVQKSKGDKQYSSRFAETAAHIHGNLRQQIGFNIVQLAAEYRALRASVLSLWQTSGSAGPTEFADTMRFNEAIDEALAQSIDRFSQDVERSRNIFLGILGHDIRTPLSAIALSAEAIARATQNPDSTAKAIGRIRRNAETIDRIVMDLLDFVRLDTGNQIPVRRMPGSLAQIAKDAVDDCEGAHPDVSLLLTTVDDSQGAWDAPRLGQAFRNLISNAIVHGTKGGSIFVGVSGSHDVVEASVASTGITIPAEALATLFDPFVRVSDPRKAAVPANDGGLGLGLYIVNEIVLAHHGELRVTSEAGKTTFTLSLPRR
jgi:signal transduction histidine kinase